jgi:hypothetical protein
MARSVDKIARKPIRIKSLLSARIKFILFRIVLNKTNILLKFDLSKILEKKVRHKKEQQICIFAKK